MIYSLLFIVLVAIGIRFYWSWLIKTQRELSHADEIHRVRTEDGWRITLYRFKSKTDSNEPVFFSHGISGSQFCFSYPKHESLIDSFTKAGYDCWALDLRGNRSSEPPPGTSRFDSTFDDFLYKDIPASLGFIEKTTGHHQVHWVGHSMGGMLIYAYACVFGSERILSGTAIGVPPGFSNIKVVRFEFLQSLIKLWPSLAEKIMQMGVLPVERLGFTNSLLPINWDNMHPTVNRFNVLELPSMKLASQMSRWVTSNTWTVNKDSVDVLAELPNMEFPLLMLSAPLDTLATTRNLNLFYDNLKFKDKQILFLSKENGYQEDYNHVDLIFSKNGFNEVHAPIIEWVQGHPKEAAQAAPSHLQALMQTQDAMKALDVPASAPAVEEPEIEIPIAAPSPQPDATKAEQWTSALSNAADMLKGFDETKAKTSVAAKKRPATTKPTRKKSSLKGNKVKSKKTLVLVSNTNNEPSTPAKKAPKLKLKAKPKKKMAKKKTTVVKKKAAKLKIPSKPKKKVTAKKAAAKKKSAKPKTPVKPKKKMATKKKASKPKVTAKKKSAPKKKAIKPKTIAKPKKKASKKKTVATKKKKTTAKRKPSTKTRKK